MSSMYYNISEIIFIKIHCYVQCRRYRGRGCRIKTASHALLCSFKQRLGDAPKMLPRGAKTPALWLRKGDIQPYSVSLLDFV